MDLLETVIRSANAGKYVTNFRDNGVEASTLKILNEDDLIILGVDDSEARKLILKSAETLQVPSEQKIDILIDKDYIKAVLEDMTNHLNKHIANLSCAILRPDVVACDISLSSSSKCLRECVSSLEKEVNSFEITINPAKEKSKKFHLRIVILPLIAITAILLSYKKIIVRFK